MLNYYDSLEEMMFSTKLKPGEIYKTGHSTTCVVSSTEGFAYVCVEENRYLLFLEHLYTDWTQFWKQPKEQPKQLEERPYHSGKPHRVFVFLLEDKKIYFEDDSFKIRDLIKII